MPAATPAPTRRLTISSCEEIAEGASNDGRPWALYRVKANDMRGQAIGVELRSFDRLEPGSSEEFIVERRESDRGVSYTLKKPRAPVGHRVAELERQTADHEVRISRMEATPPF
jgi:hypothetical protein